MSVCLIIFLYNHPLFPFFRPNTNYIFLNWGCMIYSCLLYFRISVGEISYLPVSYLDITKTLTYQQQGESIENITSRKNRKRNIVWFNPSYSKSLKTNISKYFFSPLNKFFPPGHKLYKIFDKNTLKLSYSGMPNLKAKIDAHNKKILENIPPPKTKLCNCLEKETCPMSIKESAKLLFKNVTQITKNLSIWKRTRTILNYLLNTVNWQIQNFTHRYPEA